MKIKFLLMMSALFITSAVSSQIVIYRFGLGQQKADAVIFKKDKQTVSGIVHFPDFEDKKVKIKVGENNEKYAASEIDSIQIFDADKKLSYTFLWTKTKEYKKKGTEFKVKKEGWLCKTMNGKASLYLGGLEYGIKNVKVKDEETNEKIKEAKMQVVSKQVNHYLKRSNEDYPILVSVSSNALSAGYNAFFKHFGVYYFSDSPEIAKKIEDKEYKYDDIEKVVNLYNAKRQKKAEPKAESKKELKVSKMKITPPKAESKTTKKK
ncbi:archaellin [Flavobacterium sp. HSC-32F16]|uniref:hypothetical protein n=1 Tax=Flavobacterium sp. HSC-32F16 TaxID=2910964 RepID=UPI0020A2D161|nr:hypothetical protein [Flavobacterium sp. HSC-32F16]MCP2027155.1 archaellin [Flavobacterium sp. HSC-32F16]